MDKEKQRKEISRKICERCDNFDGRACRINRTGECNLAKDSAESILNTGYGNLREFTKMLKAKKRDMTYRNGAELVYGTGVTLEDIDDLLKEYENDR